MYRYRTHGVCAPFIDFEVENNIVTKVIIQGGCRGNSQGVARLVEGRAVSEVIALLKGIDCRGGTSCPDQLALALTVYQEGGMK